MPRLYPALAQLGRCYLDKARLSHDPRWLARARAVEEKSVAIQETFEAFMAMTAIENYSHRFESAIRWAWKAADASVNGRAIMDPAVVSALVEANLGLGRIDEAQRLLPSAVQTPDRFYIAAARAQLLSATGQHDAAATEFMLASSLARREQADELASWAMIAAAGAWLDGGAIGKAKARLAQAADTNPRAVVLLIHQAELAVLENRLGDGLSLYESALAGDPDPELDRLAYVVARRLGDHARAQRHFEAAEYGLRRAIDEGEVYSLGALAQLYLDAGVNQGVARELSERNLRYKRDAPARATYRALHGSQTPPD